MATDSNHHSDSITGMLQYTLHQTAVVSTSSMPTFPA